MTGLARRTGLSLRLVRTGLEVAVVVIGLLLGGVLGVGTVVYALAIGPLTQLMLPWFTVDVTVGGLRLSASASARLLGGLLRRRLDPVGDQERDHADADDRREQHAALAEHQRQRRDGPHVEAAGHAEDDAGAARRRRGC